MIGRVVVPMVFGAVLGGAIVDLHLAQSSEDRPQQQPPRSLFQQNVPFQSIDLQVFKNLSEPLIGAAYSCGFADGMQKALNTVRGAQEPYGQEDCQKYREAAKDNGFTEGKGR